MKHGIIAAGIVGSGSLLDKYAISLFNVPVAVLFMALAGALASLAYKNKEDSDQGKKKVYMLVAVNAGLAAAAVALLPKWLGWEWYDTTMQAPLALVLGASARFVVPILTAMPAELLRKWFGLGEYKKDA